MKTIQRITFGLASSFLLSIGLSETAARMDPVTRHLESLGDTGGELAGPALPCARSMDALLAGPALPCARSMGQTSPCAFHC